MSNKRCNRIKQGYSRCGHKVNKYVFCGGGHEDTHDDRKDCYNTKELPAPTTQTAPNLPGKCPYCLADEVGWDCCRCNKVVGHDSVGSCGDSDCEHAFCLDCGTGEN